MERGINSLFGKAPVSKDEGVVGSNPTLCLTTNLIGGKNETSKGWKS